MNNLVPFSTLMILCNYYLYVVLKHFYHSQGDPTSIRHSLPVPSPPQPLAIISLLSVSVDLADLDISYRENHAVFILLLWHISLCIVLWGSSMLYHVLVPYSFSWLSNISFVCTCSILLIHLNKVLPCFCSRSSLVHTWELLAVEITAFSQGRLIHF